MSGWWNLSWLAECDTKLRATCCHYNWKRRSQANRTISEGWFHRHQDMANNRWRPDESNDECKISCPAGPSWAAAGETSNSDSDLAGGTGKHLLASSGNENIAAHLALVCEPFQGPVADQPGGPINRSSCSFESQDPLESTLSTFGAPQADHLLRLHLIRFVYSVGGLA